MKLTRILLIALAVMLPASWTVAHADDEAPAEGAAKKKTSKKKKKADEGAEEAKKAE